MIWKRLINRWRHGWKPKMETCWRRSEANALTCAQRLQQLDRVLSILTGGEEQPTGRPSAVRNPRACSLAAAPLIASEIRARLRTVGRNVRYQTLYNAMVKKPRTFLRKAGKWTLQAWEGQGLTT